jgi:hypothetical protein
MKGSCTKAKDHIPEQKKKEKKYEEGIGDTKATRATRLREGSIPTQHTHTHTHKKKKRGKKKEEKKEEKEEKEKEAGVTELISPPRILMTLEGTYFPEMA